MKTLVVPAHGTKPAANGYRNCHARGTDGLCPGIGIAKWLNEMGEDEEPYYKDTKGVVRITNGKVRDNWIAGSGHVVAVEPERAKWTAALRKAEAEVALIRKYLAELD